MDKTDPVCTIVHAHGVKSHSHIASSIYNSRAPKLNFKGVLTQYTMF